MKSSAPSRPSESSAQPPAIETRGLTRTFGSFTAVDSLDLTVRTGIVYGLLGPNGAGKSTTLRMITTLLAPTRGTARVLGHDVVAERHAVRSLIGVTGQYASVDEMLTGVENLRLFGRLLGLSRRQARERADELLASFSLTQAGGKRVSGYSGGMRRRPSRSSPRPRWSSSTSPPPGWTRAPASRCGTSSAPWWTAAPRSC